MSLRKPSAQIPGKEGRARVTCSSVPVWNDPARNSDSSAMLRLAGLNLLTKKKKRSAAQGKRYRSANRTGEYPGRAHPNTSAKHIVRIEVVLLFDRDINIGIGVEADGISLTCFESSPAHQGCDVADAVSASIPETGRGRGQGIAPVPMVWQRRYGKDK